MSRQRSPSRTAVLVSVLRAAHLHLDDAPLVFEDTLALGLSGLETVDGLRNAMDGLMARFGADLGAEEAVKLIGKMRAVMVWRARVAEERLVDCAGAGVSQCVILGAGLDSTAYRLKDTLPRMQFFEVDHEASQAWKRERLAAMGVIEPDCLRYVTVDFEHDEVLQSLSVAGMSLDHPVVVIWLGVSYYLAPRTTFDMLRVFSRLPPRSELVMDYCVPPAHWPEDERPSMAAVRRLTADSGERFDGFLEPPELAVRAAGLGLRVRADLGAPDAMATVFGHRRDGLSLSPGSPVRILNLAVPEAA